MEYHRIRSSAARAVPLHAIMHATAATFAKSAKRANVFFTERNSFQILSVITTGMPYLKCGCRRNHNMVQCAARRYELLPRGAVRTDHPALNSRLPPNSKVEIEC